MSDNQQDSNAGESSSSSSPPRGSPPPPSQSSSNGSSLVNLTEDKISSVLWLTRLFSVVCTLLYIFPFSGYHPNTLYQKTLMSGAATSALKLHQRMLNVPFQFSREYLAHLLIEDSFHYLLYSIIFLNTYPVTIVLMPIMAFALLHVTVYTNQILNLAGGPESFGLIRKALIFITSKDKDIMRFVALCEIIMAPIILFMIFTGKSGIFVPFIYYRFICLRYQSRRNPYNRVMFYELRVALEYYSNQPSCPQFVRNLTQRFIGLVIRFAPPVSV